LTVWGGDGGGDNNGVDDGGVWIIVGVEGDNIGGCVFSGVVFSEGGRVGDLGDRCGSNVSIRDKRKEISNRIEGVDDGACFWGEGDGVVDGDKSSIVFELGVGLARIVEDVCFFSEV